MRITPAPKDKPTPIETWLYRTKAKEMGKTDNEIRQLSDKFSSSIKKLILGAIDIENCSAAPIDIAIFDIRSRMDEFYKYQIGRDIDEISLELKIDNGKGLTELQQQKLFDYFVNNFQKEVIDNSFVASLFLETFVDDIVKDEKEILAIAEEMVRKEWEKTEEIYKGSGPDKEQQMSNHLFEKWEDFEDLFLPIKGILAKNEGARDFFLKEIELFKMYVKKPSKGFQAIFIYDKNEWVEAFKQFYLAYLEGGMAKVSFLKTYRYIHKFRPKWIEALLNLWPEEANRFIEAEKKQKDEELKLIDEDGILLPDRALKDFAPFYENNLEVFQWLCKSLKGLSKDQKRILYKKAKFAKFNVNSVLSLFAQAAAN